MLRKTFIVWHMNMNKPLLVAHWRVLEEGISLIFTLFGMILVIHENLLLFLNTFWTVYGVCIYPTGHLKYIQVFLRALKCPP